MTQTPFENPIKKMLREGKKTAGAWCHIASPSTVEILSRAGFDWLMIDMEHGPGDIMTLTNQLRAMNGSGAVPLVRPPWNDFVIIKRILDAGAAGLLIPYVNDRAQAQAAVRACKYPLAGIRGVAGIPRAPGYGHNSMDYMNRANEEIFIMTAVETPEALDNLDGILSVEGLDAIFIGPADLSSNMGHFCDPSHSEVQEAIRTIESKVHKSGKALATVTTSWEQARTLYERGYNMLMLMADGVSLAKLANQTVARFQQEFPNR